jgi:hypothetical protein
LLNELISRKGHNGWKLPGLSSSSSSKLVKRPPFLDNSFKDHFLSSSRPGASHSTRLGSRRRRLIVSFISCLAAIVKSLGGKCI